MTKQDKKTEVSFAFSVEWVSSDDWSNASDYADYCGAIGCPFCTNSQIYVFFCFPVSFLFVLNRLFIWYKHGHFEIVKNYLTHLFGLITCYESFRHYFNVLFEWPTHLAWTRIKIRSWKSIGNEWLQPVCLGLDLLGQ